VRQWLLSVVVPEYQVRDAVRRRVVTGGAGGPGGEAAGGAGAAGAWEVSVKVRNAGSGRMPVEVAAVRGKRFDAAGKPEPAYREARATVVLGAGEERQVGLRCLFEPDTVLIDPDARVLQLRRKMAAVKL